MRHTRIISMSIKPHISTPKIQNAINSTTSLSLKNITSTATTTTNNTNNTTTVPASQDRITFVAPTFTTAAYNDRLEKNVAPGTNITKNLSLLTSRVIDLPPKLIKHAYLGLTSNLQIQDVNNGSIFIHQQNNVANSICKQECNWKHPK
jgi:hypothetical protein